jgi:hypothetical protein
MAEVAQVGNVHILRSERDLRRKRRRRKKRRKRWNRSKEIRLQEELQGQRKHERPPQLPVRSAVLICRSRSLIY